jgi:aerobic-type carbon monoxide dehydrogenase small subunit (CoxS/CutS family)
MANVTQIHVNGRRRELNAQPERTLLSVLRDDLGLTGSKYGCGEGRCGACTVLIDGKPTRSCKTDVGSIGDRKIRTIEGLANGDRLHPVQQAFLEAGAFQCGYCTPGMIMGVTALLEAEPHPSRTRIVEGLNGNICRCGTYTRIFDAVERASRAMKGGGE